MHKKEAFSLLVLIGKNICAVVYPYVILIMLMYAYALYKYYIHVHNKFLWVYICHYIFTCAYLYECFIYM